MDLKSFIGCLIAVLFLNSCRQLVQDDFPDFEPVPVVHCMLREGKPLEMRLSWTAKIDSSRLKFIENAQVRLFVNGEYAETLTHRQKGIYDATSAVASSVRYCCEINIPDCETIIVTDSLPAMVVLSNVQLIPVSMRNEEGLPIPAVRFTFDNNPAERRYYEAVIWEFQEKWAWGFDPEFGFEKPMVVDSNYMSQVPYYENLIDPILKSEGLQIPVFSNEHIKGNEYTMTINFCVGYSRSGDEPWVAVLNPIIMELRSVSYDYYRYAKQKYLYETGFAPEFGKPAPVFSLYSNIDKGYGIFAGYAAFLSDTLTVK